jgi:glutathione S-transferase
MVKELGLDFHHVPIPPDSWAKLLSAEYLAINPNGKVPAIKDGDFILWESLAINLYLARRHPSSDLAPGTLEQEALAWQWTIWAASELDLPMITLALHRLLLPEGKRDEELARESWNTLRVPFGVLDEALVRGPYLLGATFTVADLNVASVMYRCLYLDLGRWSHLTKWLRACFSRDAARAALQMRELQVPS